MTRRSLITIVLAVFVGSALAAGAAEIKLATLVPNGSLWDNELKRMGDEWKRATDGRVGLKLFAGGVVGDDSAVVRRMRIGQLDAATLTVLGLVEIDDAFEVFNIPGFYDSYDELYAVVDTITPEIESRLEEKGYILLGWGFGGWVQLFSKSPVTTPNDIKKLKLYTSAGNDKMTSWWKSNGYRPQPLAATDIMTSLQTGMIEAVPTTPLAALTMQWYRNTPFMLERGFAPLIGATVVSKRSWNRLSEADRAAVKKAAAALDGRLREAVPGQDRDAIEQMVERGLKTTSPSGAEQEGAWEAEAAKFGDTMRKKIVPEDMYQLALKARDAYRSGQ